jgi:hypothetical protein
MAKCEVCNDNMSTAKGCIERVYLLNDGTKVKATRAGDIGDWVEPGERCGDCNAAYGEYHHIGCDIERCGHCEGQFISCDCDYSDEMLVSK